MIESIVCYIHQYCVESSNTCSGWRVVSKEEMLSCRKQGQRTKEDFYYNIYSNFTKSEIYRGNVKVDFNQILSPRLKGNPEVIHEEIKNLHNLLKEPRIVKHTNSKILNSLLYPYNNEYQNEKTKLIKFQLAWNLIQ